ncbi:MAG: TonB family protein [Flavipsychrobacter sp.]|nr:TonB family protein [Flavipsychrobacter sp.]
MLYLLQTQLYGLMMLGIYFIFLRNHRSYSWNRFYLLMSCVVPFLLPFAKIPSLLDTLPAVTPLEAIRLDEVVIGNLLRSDNEWEKYLIVLYWAVAAILLTRLLLKLLRVYKVLSTYKFKETASGILLATNTGIGPGSFGRYVFLPGVDAEAAILKHETAHVHKKHSLDVVLLEVLRVVFWPCLHLYFAERELKITHEFEADGVAALSDNAYTDVLLNSVFSTQNFALTHTFIHHPIKRRIKMLQKNESRTKVRTLTLGSAVMTLLFIGGIAYLQSCKGKPKEMPTANKGRTATANEQQEMKEENGVWNYVEQMPVSKVSVPEYLGANIKYPEYAKKNRIEGRVVLKFVIDENGNINSVEAVKSPDASLTEEAIRVVKSMPRWEPGKHDGKAVKVSFFLPISFKLS